MDLETCVHKYRAMRSVRPTQQDEKCRVCTKTYELNCKSYKPISRTQEPLRKGYNAYINGVFL